MLIKYYYYISHISRGIDLFFFNFGYSSFSDLAIHLFGPGAGPTAQCSDLYTTDWSHYLTLHSIQYKSNLQINHHFITKTVAPIATRCWHLVLSVPLEPPSPREWPLRMGSMNGLVECLLCGHSDKASIPLPAMDGPLARPGCGRLAPLPRQ